MQTEVFTRVDAVEHLLDVMNTTNPDDRFFRLCKRAVETAYRELPTLRKWSYYYALARLSLDAYYNTGTLAYDHTGGANERMVTLTDGTWPSWAKFGYIRIDDVDYEIATRESDTVITLSVNSNPGSDIAAGETYELFRDTYPLPVDFTAMGFLRDSTSLCYVYLSPADFVSQKISKEGAGHPRSYTIVADQNYIGTLSLKVFPPPDDDYALEYQYIRRPRPFGVYQYTDGTITSSGTTVTGTGTAFTDSMIGCVIRHASSATTGPSGTSGSTPFTDQRIVTGVTNGTTLVLDQAFDTTAAGYKYEISDPIDIESGSMYTAFLRRAEFELAQLLNRDDLGRFAQQLQDAEIRAREGDRRSYEPTGPVWFPRVAGGNH